MMPDQEPVDISELSPEQLVTRVGFVGGNLLEEKVIPFLGDIHGNMHALSAAQEDMQTLNCDLGTAQNLGDVVGYCAFPCECIDAVKVGGNIEGNHDYAAHLTYVLDASLLLEHLHPAMRTEKLAKTRLLNNLQVRFDFSTEAHLALEWTIQELLKQGGEDIKHNHYLQFLKSLCQQDVKMYPGKKQGDVGEQKGHVLYVYHAAPLDPLAQYISPPEDEETPEKREERRNYIIRNFREGDFDQVCFAAHSHIPGVFFEDGAWIHPNKLKQTKMGAEYAIKPGQRAIINVGSVGQPRDRDPRACYVLFDGDRVFFRRVRYDIKGAIDALIDRRVYAPNPKLAINEAAAEKAQRIMITRLKRGI